MERPITGFVLFGPDWAADAVVEFIESRVAFNRNFMESMPILATCSSKDPVNAPTCESMHHD